MATNSNKVSTQDPSAFSEVLPNCPTDVQLWVINEVLTTTPKPQAQAAWQRKQRGKQRDAERRERTLARRGTGHVDLGDGGE